jgi:hypothetical protein
LDDKAIMVVVSLHLGAKLCEPHQVSMQSQWQPRGHTWSGMQMQRRRTSPSPWPDSRALNRIKEPDDLQRPDGKQPDKLARIPWHGGWCITLDITMTDMIAESYVVTPSTVTGWAAEQQQVQVAEIPGVNRHTH